MAQTKNPRRVGQTEARAKLVNVRISPQKLNLVAASIRGLPVQKALNELEFSRKRIATDVRAARETKTTETTAMTTIEMAGGNEERAGSSASYWISIDKDGRNERSGWDPTA